MSFVPSSLASIVQRLLPASAGGTLCVAFSGGLDSTVLLEALTRVWPKESLRAVHVNHQLQPAAADWEQHCASVAATLGVPFMSRRVEVQPLDGGMEAAARTARYAAFAQLLRSGEALLTAHHADDQFETMLLALARGSGLNGLAAMPSRQAFAAGWHLRPLLEYTREDLERWARAQALRWIEDPSNQQRSFNRNFLRHDIIPLLQQRWPAIAANAVRSASHFGEAMDLLDDLARLDSVGAGLGPCLRVEALARLAADRRRNLLRYWLRSRGLRPPSTRSLAALEHDMLAAQDDRQPVVAWDGFEVRRYRGLLYAAPALLEFPADAATQWDWQQPLALPGELGTLHAEATTGVGLKRADLPAHLSVEFRRSGQVLRPAGRTHHRTVKNLLQEAGVLPWWRNRLPMIRIDGALVAIGDLWVADEFAARQGDEGIRIVWQDRPQIKVYSPPVT